MARYQFFAVCPRHTEPLVIEELASHGVTDARAYAGGVQFACEPAPCMAFILHTRIASKVLLRIASRVCADEDALYATARRIPWEKCFGVEKSVRVDVSAHRSPLASLDFALLRVKDAVCDRFRDTCGARPDVDKGNPGVRIHVFLDGTTATFYFNVAGEALFKRGWRTEKGEAPLKENLAASLLKLAGWNPSIPLMDPFCGSGTIAIEAAQTAIGLPAGLSRRFGFENLRLFDAEVFAEIREEAKSRVRYDAPVKIAASDISTIVVGKARANALRAGLGALLEDGRLTFAATDARDLEPAGAPGFVVCNPPYGEQSNPKSASVAGMVKDVGNNFKRRFAGWSVFMLTSDRALPREMRLKESRKIEIYNGPLECRFFRFDMVAGSNRKP